MIIRKATPMDIDGIERVYDAIHDDPNGSAVIGWQKGVYPVRKTAADAVARGDMYVMVEDEIADSCVVGAAILNNVQLSEYYDADWRQPASDNEVLVMHTLVIDPACSGKGYGRSFAQFYEELARSKGCLALRIDTNERNTRARALYASLGYEEIGMIPCEFNGIPGVHLVLLEKVL